ncbi:MAG: RDD family protein [Acidimicrobiia bacterium]|nr:RDD family protein [Acidimicrobiia bacterium]
MTFEERLTISTPEGVDVEIRLAGLGSRFVAAIIDVLIWGVAIIALLAALGSVDSGYARALTVVLVFVTIFGYDVAFEMLNAGRTPGKAALGLRVTRNGGGPVRFLDSAVRNLLRVVDFLPLLYGVGATSIVVTKRNQRLGDLAGGTVVQRDRNPAPVLPATYSAPPIHPYAAAWDVSAVTDDDLAALRRFLERRADLEASKRALLASDLAGRLAPRVSGPRGDESPDFILEQIVAVKSARRSGGAPP